MICTSTNNSRRKIYEHLFSLCPRLPAIWDFVPVVGHCRGPVSDPMKALASLRLRFSDAPQLEGAEVLAARGEGRLRSELCDPGGAVIALRDHVRREPFALLTARGCLPSGLCPVLTALKDVWTAERVEETGIMFGTFSVREAVLLRSLGLPAAPCFGMHRLPAASLRAIDDTFSSREAFLGFERKQALPRRKRIYAANDPIPESYSPYLHTKPTLALVGWSPLSISAACSPLLFRTATYLAAARRFLGYPFFGVMVWRPAAEELESLRFRVTFKDVRLVRELLLATTDSLYDFAHFTGPEGLPEPKAVPTTFAAARAELVASLESERGHGHMSARVQAAREVHDRLAEQELVKPLREWALASGDSVIRNAGVELAEICALLHRMSPTLQTLQSRQWEKADGEDIELIPPKAYTQYLQMVQRMGTLIRDLRSWDKWM